MKQSYSSYNGYVINDNGLTRDENANINPCLIPKVFIGMYVSPYEDGHIQHKITINGHLREPHYYIYKALNQYPECSELPKIVFARSLTSTKSYASWLPCSVSWITID